MKGDDGQAFFHISLVANLKTRFIFRMRTIVSSPALLFSFVDLFCALCGFGMLESMLEPHLRATGAKPIDVGVSFLLFGCCYMIGNMLFGVVNLLLTMLSS